MLKKLIFKTVKFLPKKHVAERVGAQGKYGSFQPNFLWPTRIERLLYHHVRVQHKYILVPIASCKNPFSGWVDGKIYSSGDVKEAINAPLIVSTTFFEQLKFRFGVYCLFSPSVILPFMLERRTTAKLSDNIK